MWDRLERRLRSKDVALMRRVRRLLDLPARTAVAELQSEFASMDAEALRQLASILLSVEQSALRQLSAPGPNGSATPEVLAGRVEIGFALFERTKQRLEETSSDASPPAMVSQSKLDRYVALVKALARSQADKPAFTMSDETIAECTRLRGELERLLDVEPADYLRADIGEAIATVWDGLGDQLNTVPNRSEEAKRHYLRASAIYGQIGKSRAAHASRLKAVAMIRRVAANFDQTVQELSAILGRFPADEASIERAEIRVELAQTYNLVGDRFALGQQLAAIASDLVALGYAPPHPEDAERSLAGWIDHADAVCASAEDVEAALASLLALHAAIFAMRGASAADETLAAEHYRAAGAFTRLGQELIERVKAILIADSRERAAFLAEYGDGIALEPLSPSGDGAPQVIAAYDRLDRALDALRSQIARGKEAGALMDDLLPGAREIATEARQCDFEVIAANAMLLEADIHIAAERYEDAVATARAAFDMPRDRQRDLTIGLSALNRIVNANIAQRDDAAVSAICGEAIALIERHRHNVNAPYSQSAYLGERARYYATGIVSAYKLDDFDTMLQRADLSKAGATLRQIGRLSRGIEDDQLRAQFKEVSRQIEASPAGRQEAIQALAARRRVLWDLLAISRAHGARDTGAGADPPLLTVKALAAALDADEAVIYYYWLAPTVLLIAAFDSRRIIIEKKEIESADRRKLEEFAAFVQSLREASSYLDRIRQFSTLLMPASIEPILRTKRRLLLSLHRLLHALPLHALAYDGDLLIRRFAVTYIPNLGCLLRNFEPMPAPRVLAVGIRDFAVPGATLRPLEDSDREIGSVAAAYRDRGIAVTVLASETATVQEIRRLESDEELAEFSCIHLATHGADVLGDNPMEAHLWLHDGPLDGLEIANWRLKAELVVLSACHSGQRAIAFRGESELAGDEIFGLQAALFVAGAARVVGALWPAESAVASRLMAAFQDRVAAGVLPELALQAAMLDYIDGATLQSRKAYYWAPFYIAAVARPRRSTVTDRSEEGHCHG